MGHRLGRNGSALDDIAVVPVPPIGLATHPVSCTWTSRTRAPASRRHDGAGLWLPLARRLARAVSGGVSYDPAPAPGACLTVSPPFG
ncbi:hypothetical protein GCM10010276_38370 [Streptomyces longisporus]|uniref:Uncharacterized protein n=1 Tax=Streptomyces longisporus TaxID=1948 RepID=A0ABN3M1T8_STRLO